MQEVAQFATQRVRHATERETQIAYHVHLNFMHRLELQTLARLVTPSVTNVLVQVILNVFCVPHLIYLLKELHSHVWLLAPTMLVISTKIPINVNNVILIVLLAPMLQTIIACRALLAFFKSLDHL